MENMVFTGRIVITGAKKVETQTFTLEEFKGKATIVTNRYGNNFGFHSPKKTEKTLLKVNSKCKIEFYDSSYKNDVLDSIEHEISEDNFLKVFIPNSKKDDEARELFNKYAIIKEGNILFESKKLKKLIKFINNLEF